VKQNKKVSWKGIGTMADKNKAMEIIKEHKVIAIIRGVRMNNGPDLVKALYQGGIRIVEFTFDLSVPESYEDTAALIQCSRETYGESLVVGAGTVTSTALVQKAAQAGTAFIVSPNTDKAVIEKTVQLGMISIPGAATPSEIISAYAFGANAVKLFPAGILGLPYFKAVRAPINHIPLFAVGNVGEDNISDFIKAGAMGVGIGGNLVNKKWVADGAFDKISATAARLTELVKEIRKE
jgi:2-dehydro-3-deoxyphosphogluconate aldolase/(4S)-4-hydroxy-2-oxoglutarate aldolase